MHFHNVHLSPGRRNFSGNLEDEQEEFAERLRKTLYYGKPPTTDRPSLPLTDLAVEYFQEAAPKELGKLDTYFAASSSRSACMSPSSVMAGMMYTRRLRKKNPSYLYQVSSSDLFLISMMMASKFMYDEGVDEEVFNDEWADAGNMDVEDVNTLEREFLSAIDWELFVRPEEFSEMLQIIEKRIALQQGVDRGWFSYCDLVVLSQDTKLLTWSALTADLSKVILVSSLAYVAGLLTIVCSTILATTLSTGIVSLGSSLVLRPPSTPAVVPPITDIEESPLTHDMREIDSFFTDILSNIGAGNSGVSVDVVLQPGNKSIQQSTEHAVPNQLRNYLNSLLPPLLALVSLKDSFIDFVNAVRDRNTNNLDRPKNVKSDLDEICSDGPCQQETWPGCWNTSDSSDLSHDYFGSHSFDSYFWNDMESDQTDQPGKGCQNCGDMIKKLCPFKGHCRELAAQNVRCCCSVKGHYSQTDRIDWFHPVFSELSSLGFMTNPGNPFVVTT